MEKQPSIKKNFIMNTLLTMSSIIFPLITFPYVSRILLPIGMGKVAFATSLVSYFSLIAQLGIPTYGIRACARVRDDREELSKTAQELIIINLVTSAVAYLFFAIVLIAVPRLQEDRELYVLISITILLNAIGMEWLYKALEKYTYIATRSILFKAIALVAMFALIHSQSDYVIYGGISVFAASASNIVNLIHSRKYIDWKHFNNYQFSKHLKPICVFFAMACATTIYTNLDELMLGFMVGDIEVGYYDAATKIKKVLVSVVTSLGVVVLPRASYYVQKGKKEEFWNIASKALNFIILLAGPLMVFFALFSKNVIMLLSGPAYEKAILPMQILMPTLLFIGITNVLGIQIMIPLGKEKSVLYSEILGAVVDGTLNFILIPQMGAAGAAIGTVAAEFAVLVYQGVSLRENIIGIIRDIRIIKPIIAITCATALSLVVTKSTNNNFVTLTIAAVAFFVIYVIVLLLTREPLAIEIMQSFRRKISS